MRLVLQILLKDLRRHWRETALFILVTLGWAWQQAHPYKWLWVQQRNVLPVLFYLLWFFITVRVVQGESLVGDREFWPTRPYRWWQLMAAKTIFLALCLNFPLLAMQIYLLAAVGFPLQVAYLPGLLWLQLAFALIFTLTSAALATLTESLVQWVLTVVGLALIAMLLSWPPWNKLPVTLVGAEESTTILGFVLVGSALVFVLFWQYIRRRVWTGRIVLAAVLFAIPTMIAFSWTSWIRSVAYRVAPESSDPPMRLSIAQTGSSGEHSYSRMDQSWADPEITVPLAFTSVSPDSMIVVEGSRFTLDGDGGWHWQSQWLRSNVNLTSEESTAYVSFEMPIALADQMRSKHPRAHAEVAVAVYRLSAPKRIDTSPAQFEIPNVATCRWYGREVNPWNGFEFRRGEVCVAPLRLPDVVIERIESADVTCAWDAGEHPLPPGHHAVDYKWDTVGGPAEFDPNPVHRLSLELGSWVPAIPDPHNPKTNLQSSLCPGTPITVRTGSFAGRLAISADLGGLGREARVKPSLPSDFPE